MKTTKASALSSTFIRLWAIANLISLLSAFDWSHYPISLRAFFCILYWFSALALAFGRLRFPILGLFLAASIALTAIELPEVPNHRLVILFCNLFIAMALLAAVFGRHTWNHYFEKSLTNVRFLLLALYFFATFSKLNTGYFEQQTSCALLFYQHLEYFLFVLPPADLLPSTLIFASIAVECAIFLLLFSRHYRLWALRLALLFHFFLSWDLDMFFANFSAPVSLMLLFCMPEQWLQALPRFLAQGPKSKFLRPLHLIHTSKGLWLVLLAAALSFFAQHTQDPAGLWYKTGVILSQLCWLSFILPLIGYALGSHQGDTPTDRSEANGLTWQACSYALYFLILVNGLSPYLGLKTRSAFSMYSNLRLSADSSNHVIIPKSADLFGMLSETVVIPSDSPRLCGGRLIGGATYPSTEIARAARFCPEQELPYIGPPSLTYWQHKLTYFLPLDSTAERVCLW